MVFRLVESLFSYWLPVLILVGVMLLLFLLPSDAVRQVKEVFSPGKFVKVVKEGKLPGLSGSFRDLVKWAKVFHFFAFALLSFLVIRAVFFSPWSFVLIFPVAVVTLVIFAWLTEYLQGGTPDRTGTLQDVCVNIVGASFGIGLFCLYIHFRPPAGD